MLNYKNKLVRTDKLTLKELRRELKCYGLKDTSNKAMKEMILELISVGLFIKHGDYLLVVDYDKKIAGAIKLKDIKLNIDEYNKLIQKN